MRSLITAACIALTATSANALCQWGEDSPAHFVRGALASEALYQGAKYLDLKRPHLWSLGGTLVLSYVSEKTWGEFDERDICADMAGAVAMRGVSWSIGLYRDRVTVGIQRRF